MTLRACRFCGDSGRPGYVVSAHYHDRMERTDVIGEYRLTSGVEWGRCFHCHGSGQQTQDEWDRTPECRSDGEQASLMDSPRRQEEARQRDPRAADEIIRQERDAWPDFYREDT